MVVYDSGKYVPDFKDQVERDHGQRSTRSRVDPDVLSFKDQTRGSSEAGAPTGGKPNPQVVVSNEMNAPLEQAVPEERSIPLLDAIPIRGTSQIQREEETQDDDEKEDQARLTRLRIKLAAVVAVVLIVAVAVLVGMVLLRESDSSDAPLVFSGGPPSELSVSSSSSSPTVDELPTMPPTEVPTKRPTKEPTARPTPTTQRTTNAPSLRPTPRQPTRRPTVRPTQSPTSITTPFPTPKGTMPPICSGSFLDIKICNTWNRLKNEGSGYKYVELPPGLDGELDDDF